MVPAPHLAQALLIACVCIVVPATQAFAQSAEQNVAAPMVQEDPAETQDPETPSVVPDPTALPVVVTSEPEHDSATDVADAPTLEATSHSPPATTVPEPTFDPTAPAPTPSIEPTPSPAFDPNLTCIPEPGHTNAIAGSSAWSLLECTVAWTTDNVSQIDVTIPPAFSAPGWDVELFDPSSGKDQPTGLATLTMTPQANQARFVVGSRLSCTAAAGAELPFLLTAYVGGEGVAYTTDPITLEGIPPSPPTVDVTAAAFETVDTSSATHSSGVITLSFRGAQPACGWTVTTTFADFVSDAGVIPAANLELESVNGLPSATSTQVGSAISLHVPPGADSPSSGTILLTVSMPVPHTTIQGEYTTTISSTAGLP